MNTVKIFTGTPLKYQIKAHLSIRMKQAIFAFLPKRLRPLENRVKNTLTKTPSIPLSCPVAIHKMKLYECILGGNTQFTHTKAAKSKSAARSPTIHPILTHIRGLSKGHQAIRGCGKETPSTIKGSKKNMVTNLLQLKKY